MCVSLYKLKIKKSEN